VKWKDEGSEWTEKGRKGRGCEKLFAKGFFENSSGGLELPLFLPLSVAVIDDGFFVDIERVCNLSIQEATFERLVNFVETSFCLA